VVRLEARELPPEQADQLQILADGGLLPPGSKTTLQHGSEVRFSCAGQTSLTFIFVTRGPQDGQLQQHAAGSVASDAAASPAAGVPARDASAEEALTAAALAAAADEAAAEAGQATAQRLLAESAAKDAGGSAEPSPLLASAQRRAATQVIAPSSVTVAGSALQASRSCHTYCAEGARAAVVLRDRDLGGARREQSARLTHISLHA
jgi:hypothetical protein